MTAAPHPTTDVHTVAAFDLDGTLTFRDTMLPFVVRVRGRAVVARAAIAVGPALLRPSADVQPRQRAKEALFMRTLRGFWLEELRPVAEEHARDIVDNRLRPDRLQRLRWHQQQGHDVVLVSASPDLYVAAIGRLLGCTATLATRLEVDRRGRLTGRLFGDNVRGAEKARLLRAWLGDSASGVTLYAYGDSAGDADMLAMADVATLVRGRDRLTAAPASAGNGTE